MRNFRLLTLSSDSPRLNLHLYTCRVVYIPTQIINFAIVPPQFRYVFVSVVSLVWSTSIVPLWRCLTESLIAIDTYLSFVNAQLGSDIAEPVGY